MKYTGNEICDYCIEIMEWWSKNTPLTYGEINVLLFIIIQPVLTMICAFSVIYIYRRKSLAVLYLNIFIILGYIIGTIMLLLLPRLNGL